MNLTSLIASKTMGDFSFKKFSSRIKQTACHVLWYRRAISTGSNSLYKITRPALEGGIK
jgi:hypothetical protein